MATSVAVSRAWVPMRDGGTQLSAKLWLPAAAGGPCPAVLEFLPYRLDDGTLVRASTVAFTVPCMLWASRVSGVELCYGLPLWLLAGLLPPPLAPAPFPPPLAPAPLPPPLAPAPLRRG